LLTGDDEDVEHGNSAVVSPTLQHLLWHLLQHLL
jgi:hypothetical protein